jgi:hypothetical protein
MATSHDPEERSATDEASEDLARKAFYATVIACLAFALSVFLFVL